MQAVCKQFPRNSSTRNPIEILKIFIFSPAKSGATG